MPPPTQPSWTPATDSTAAGAPVIGYVENRTKPPSFWRLPIVRMLKRTAGAFVAIALVYTGFTGYQIYDSWSGVERQTLDTSEAEILLPPTTAPPPADIVEDEPEVRTPRRSRRRRTDRRGRLSIPPPDRQR